MITVAEIAQIQADAAIALDLSCAINRGTRTTSTQGGAKFTYATINTVNAGMSPPTALQLQNFNYLVANLAAWQVKFPVGTDVQHGDQLVINGRTLNVQAILTPRSYQILLTVLATEAGGK